MRYTAMRSRIRHLPHVVRLTAFGLCAAIVVSMASLRSARAHMQDGMAQLARQLMPYAEQATMESPRRVELNGETMYLAVGTTRDGPDAVLDWYESRCAQASGEITRAVRVATQQSSTLEGAAFNQLWTALPGRRHGSMETLRGGDAQGGYVACIDTGAGRLSPAEIARRLRAMVDTGDLGQLGGMRYVYAQRGMAGTRILTVATEGRFNLFRMFPPQGDAPGEDVVAMPRFPGMRRVLSAHEDGHAYGLGMYAARASLADVKAYYTHTLPQHGWAAMTFPSNRPLPPEIRQERDHMAAFARGDATLLLVFDQREGTTSMMALAGL